MEKLRKFIAPAIIIALFYVLLHIIGIGCPIKFITGISCPGCGMSRAALSLLRLDFAAAFYYHPFFPLVFIMAGIFILRIFEKIPKKTYDIAIFIFCGAFLLLWLFRMIFGDGEIVSFNPQSSVFVRIFKFLFSR